MDIIFFTAAFVTNSVIYVGIFLILFIRVSFETFEIPTYVPIINNREKKNWNPFSSSLRWGTQHFSVVLSVSFLNYFVKIYRYLDVLDGLNF